MLGPRSRSSLYTGTTTSTTGALVPAFSVAGITVLIGLTRRWCLRILGERLDELLEDGEVLALLALREDRRPVEHRVGDEDARAAAHRKRDGIRGTAVDLDLLLAELQEQAAVEDPTAALVGDEIAHDDAGDLRSELGEHVHHQIVRERTFARDARDARRDAVRLIGTDPDREKTVRLARLEEHDVLPGKHVHADRFDRAWHEHRLRLTPADARAAGRRALTEHEQQNDTRGEPEEMREVRDLLRRCVGRHAQLRDALEYLQDDEEADHDDRRQIDHADEQPEEDER